MKLKKYTADSLRAALRLARIELGADATLVDSKEASAGDGPRFEATFAVGQDSAGALGDNRMPDGRHWRSYVPPEIREEEASNIVEVRPQAAAVAEDSGSAAAPARALEQVAAELQATIEEGRAEPPPAAETAPRQPDPNLKAILIQLRALQSSVEALRRLDRPSERAAPPSAVRQALQLLLGAGLDLATWPRIGELIEAEADRGRNSFELAAWLRAQLSAGWNIAPSLRADDGSPLVAAFVGPSGAGKTSSLLKLAVQQGLRCNRNTHLVLADPVRWGSAEALGAQAESAGALLTVARGPDDLTKQLERARAESPADGLILIDTPSYAPSETSRAEDLAAALAEAEGVETHLTLSAAMGAAELRRAVECSTRFSPSRLLFTHVDVALQPGVIWNESSRCGLPISFLGTGPKTPEDLRPANAGRLTNLLFSR